MSLFRVAAGNILSGLQDSLAQSVGGKQFGIGTETEEGAYQPIIFCWWAAKTEQASILAKGLNSVAQLGIAFHNQNSACCQADAYFWMRGVVVRKLGVGRFYVFWGLGYASLDEAVNAVSAFFLAFKRVGFAVPEACGGIESMREDGLL